MNNRRKLIIALGAGALAVPFHSLAQQQAKVYRIGLLSPFSPADAATWHEAFRQGLRDLGWIEGKNISIDYRYAEGKNERLADFAAELVRSKVDIIVTSVTPDAAAAKKATGTIPIVMASVGDPIASGFVDNLARPGGNITGLSQMAPELTGKRLEMLKQIIPRLSRIAVLWNPEDQMSAINWKEIQLPARKLGVQIHSMEAPNLKELDKQFEDAAKARAGAIIIMPNSAFMINLKRIADLAAKNHLPSIFHIGEFASAGGLLAYGPDRADLFRRAATYVDKILKGAKIGDLPIEQPVKFELVINLKTAKALGLKIPQSLLIRADKVIE